MLTLGVLSSVERRKMPSSKNYKRDYHQEYLNDSSTRRKQRAQRNKARRMMEARGLAHKGDGKDVGHLRAMSRGGTTVPSNLAMQSAAANRSFARKSSGAMLSETSKRERKRK